MRMQGENRYELDETRTCVPVFLFQLPCCLDLFELISNTLFLLSDDIALKRHSHCFKERVRLVLPTSYTYTPFNTRPLYRSFNHFALSLNNSRQPLKQQKPRQRQKKRIFRTLIPQPSIHFVLWTIAPAMYSAILLSLLPLLAAAHRGPSRNLPNRAFSQQQARDGVTPGGYQIVGDSGVSAQMLFLG